MVHSLDCGNTMVLKSLTFTHPVYFLDSGEIMDGVLEIYNTDHNWRQNMVTTDYLNDTVFVLFF